MNPTALVVLLALAGASCTTTRRDDPTPERDRFRTTTTNQLTLNQLTLNQLTLNQLTLNQLTLNQLTLNGLAAGPLVQSALTSDIPHPDGGTQGEAARTLLRYLYSCAMPAGASMQLVIDGADYGTYEGALGLAPEWGAGSCDETCQRWITACLLARTNYYGVAVPISVRGPHPALSLTPDEEAAYPLREGSYYGNLFAEPRALVACSGPGSSITELTARVCSSSDLGSIDDCAFDVYGQCQASFCGLPSCDGEGEGGASLDCSDGMTRYAEVLTVYLAAPAPVCGDGICQTGETAASCDADCLQGWARRLGHAYGGNVAVAPGGEIAVTGGFPLTVDLGGGPIAATPGDSYLARYGVDGGFLWGKRLGCNKWGEPYPLVAVDPTNGDIVVAGALQSSCALGGATLTNTGAAGTIDLFLARYDADGNHLWSLAAGSAAGDDRVLSVAIAPGGDVLLAGTFAGTIDVGAGTLATAGDWDQFVARFDAAGTPLWSVRRGGPDRDATILAAFAPDGGVVTAGRYREPAPGGLFLEGLGAAGAVAWTATYPTAASAVPRAIGVDDLGVAVAGTFGGGSLDLGGGAMSPIGNDPAGFAARFSATGAPVWSRAFHGSLYVWPRALALDPEGAVIVGGSFYDVLYDLGGGTLRGVENENAFLVKLGAEGEHLWSRRMGGLHATWFSGLGRDDAGRVVAGGEYDTSSVVAGFLLDGGDEANTCSQNVYLASARDEAQGERCNGLDDDGDGAIDEGLELGRPCDGPDPDGCAEGTIVCDAAGTGTQCDDTTGNSMERCNSLDDDCSGRIDETFPGLWEPCDGPDLDPCVEGVMVCVGDGLSMVCSDTTGESVEACNGLDDDCDGAADEDFPAGCPIDAGPLDGPDAGGAPLDDGGGCGCRAVGAGGAGGGAVVLALALLLGARRRRVRR